MTCVHVDCAECIKPHHEVDCFSLQLVLLLVTEMLWVVGVIKGALHVSYKNKGCIASTAALGTWGKGASGGAWSWLFLHKID